MRRTFTVKAATLITLAMLTATLCAPQVHASAPGPDGNSNSTATSTPVYSQPAQSASWLAAKNAFKVRSGLQPGQPKGTKSSPYIVFQSLAPQAGYRPPAYLTLRTDNAVPSTFEPGNGNARNFTGNFLQTDDKPQPYSDLDFVNLCGPGAADTALYYWPAPPNYINGVSATDTAKVGGTNPINVTTFWNSSDTDNVNRMRGYMTRLAWQIQWPGWPHAGMMDISQYPSYGTTLYGMQNALNWEASGENSSNWSSYFYTIQWVNGASQSLLHQQVVIDVASSSAPVVAEVNAQLLPNWTNQYGLTRHFITIIGYDDNAGVFYYTDTCASLTGCGSNTNGGVQSVPQGQMWNAIQSVPENQSTSPSGGDGGWVW